MAPMSIGRQIPPSDFHCLKDMIANRQITFPKRLEQVARVALDSPDLVAFESSIDLATRCGVSTATVIRFARHLGFKNFREMRLLFRSCLTDLA